MTREALINAQNVSIQFFKAVEENEMIVAGKTEAQLNEEICFLALKEFGIRRHWHKKIVRAGKNTLSVYHDDPPDRVIDEDDILFIDLGPVVKGYEADIGRTYVLGKDPRKLKLKKDVEAAWHEIQAWYQLQTTLKASALFQYAAGKAEEYGWEFGGAIAGHIIGKYPHEQPLDPLSLELDIHPDNPNDMFLRDEDGNERHWILELQFTDRGSEIGGYFEQML
ncbi:M24 family metallopeptidase [Flavitalea sp. BT771]|uniref:M24 family metallopeptidase n=1 Tax=Flavitalea sp. BT771 TaxID=3063329 RepID=UPI0026E12B12|nr:M24 family metallopeptidase [Flavitalea sp. BT771]MDO6433661.1 M24 family metallopeptidase [Flavitalea sp. BT771]MDV6222434.1 M24 family metallopeptidase [Flavitalea sp. BT771]